MQVSAIQDLAAFNRCSSSYWRLDDALADQIIDQIEQHSITSLSSHDVDSHRQVLDMSRDRGVVRCLTQWDHEIWCLREDAQSASAEAERNSWRRNVSIAVGDICIGAHV